MSKEIILKRPILTEKALIQQEEDNKFAFVVDPNANKIEIRNAVENKFEVDVDKVNVMNYSGKEREMTVRSGGQVIRTQGKKSNWKKAIVTLVEGENIDFYRGETAV